MRRHPVPVDDGILPDRLPIALRAYLAPKAVKPAQGTSRSPLDASKWTLIFDTETTIDPSQRLRFGAYQVRKHQALHSAGLFYDPDVMNAEEIVVLKAFAAERKIECLLLTEFINQVFYRFGYDYGGAVIGFNLPFDLSRLAISHGLARRRFRGGFSFRLSENQWHPNVQIKHLSARAALIQFTGTRKRQDNRRERASGRPARIRRGTFIDLKTLAAALTSRSFSLARLADYLQTDERKADTNDHGQALNAAYVAYAVQDVEVTWQCFKALSQKLDAHQLKHADASKLYSEASLGKAYLKDMGIQPWRKAQPDFPDTLTGTIMSTYFGGRAEVHLRRAVEQVLYCDFLSMYPTVCTLMGLWRYVIAKGVTWTDCTHETRDLLANIATGDLQNPDFWPRLTTLVQVAPDDDIFPVRAKYEETGATTIGLNHLTASEPLWFTLADCIASKLLNGRSPSVLQAISFMPIGLQERLKCVQIGNTSGPIIDPTKGDFYRQLIDLRTETKEKIKTATPDVHAVLETEQLALKILANATSYGIFVELNVEELPKADARTCHGQSDEAFSVKLEKAESPGTYFHPLIGTLITGAARLMLALSERLILDKGLDWALCDTDSMAIAKPHGLDHTDFFEAAQSVCDWFLPLNPYTVKGPLLKVEAINFAKSGAALEPLYCLAISAKRYVMFNLTDAGELIIRKASAHGLGHLLPPYDTTNPSALVPPPAYPLHEIGVELWQHDLWFQIIAATLAGHPDQPDLSYHPALEQPARSRYGATTPDLLNWFKAYNMNLPYKAQVRPFNFLIAFQTAALWDSTNRSPEPADPTNLQSRKRRKPQAPKPIAPYARDIETMLLNSFDRETGNPIRADQLKSYSEAIAQYHLQPESKFLNGNFLDSGATKRRHVIATEIRMIGKEANRLEEQTILGLDNDAELDYGTGQIEADKLTEILRHLVAEIGQREVAARLVISRGKLSRMLREGMRSNSPMLSRKITSLYNEHIRDVVGDQEHEDDLNKWCEQQVRKDGLTNFCRQIGIDPSNFRKCLNGNRSLSIEAAAKLRRL